MPDIADPDTGTYVDRLTVIYESVEYPDKPPLETVVLIVDAGKQINRKGLRRQVEQLHFRRDRRLGMNADAPIATTITTTVQIRVPTAPDG